MTKKVNTGHISLVSFENHKLPEFREVKNKDWVYYGEDNLYPDYLIQLFTRNAFHNSIITGKSSFIFGKGLGPIDEKQDEKAEAFIKMANSSEGWNDVLEKVIVDFELFNGFAIEIIWANGKPYEYYHLDFSKIRVNKDCTVFYYCDNWKQSRPQEDESFKELTPFSSSGKGSQIFYFKHYRPYASGNSNVYPLPDYVGCVADIETDIEITNFHYNNTKHGFSAGTMVNFNNGVPTQDKIDQIEKKFKGKFTGTDKGGNIIITFNDSKDKEATVLSLQPNNLDKQFEILATRLQQNIFTGHKVTTPMLFGIKTAGQLGGRTEMLDGWEHFKNTYVQTRRAIIEKTVNVFAKISGVPELVLIEEAPIGFALDANVISEVLTEDEKRELIGYKPKVKVDDTQLQKQNFSNEKKLIEAFKKVGTSADDFIVIREKKFCFHSEEELKQFFAGPLTVDISSIEQKILAIIKKDPLVSIKDIAKALKIKVAEATEGVNNLSDKEYIKTKSIVKDDEPMIERTLTKGGGEIINDVPDKIVDISLVYQYRVMPGLGANIISTTREFCREIIKENKKYTRKEIEQVSNEVGYSVFRDRGGFYHNPKTGETTPYCRHEWVQQVVKKIR